MVAPRGNEPVTFALSAQALLYASEPDVADFDASGYSGAHCAGCGLTGVTRAD